MRDLANESETRKLSRRDLLKRAMAASALGVIPLATKSTQTLVGVLPAAPATRDLLTEKGASVVTERGVRMGLDGS